MENKRAYCERRAAYRSQKIIFREFAATLPYIVRKSFIQRAYRVVAATKSVAAKGHLA